MQFPYVKVCGTCSYHSAPTSPSGEINKERVVVRFLFERISLRMSLLCFRESSWTLRLKMGTIVFPITLLSIPGKGKIFVFSSVQTGSGVHLVSYPMGTERALSPGVKATGT
jgi:hypothetical protein